MRHARRHAWPGAAGRPGCRERAALGPGENRARPGRNITNAPVPFGVPRTRAGNTKDPSNDNLNIS